MARSRTLLLLSVSLLLALGMLWSQGVFSAVSPPPPTVGTPVAQPSTLAVNYATLLTVTSRITTSPGNPVVPASVKLESVDANGAVLATLGTMYDDGTHGDMVAGDGIFTVQVGVTETAPGAPRLQVAATFKAGPGRLVSAVTVVPIVFDTAPVANAGPDQRVSVGTTVHLDASRSSDRDGDLLTAHWTVLSRPPSSSATLSNPTAVRPSLVVDQPGDYVVQLLVNDGLLDSAPDTVLLSTVNVRPVAHAGPDQKVARGTTVQLDGSHSSDVDGDRLTFRWTVLSQPPGGQVTLSSPTAIRPTFVVQRPGTYVLQLIVNDGLRDSKPATVTISTDNTAPVANAGPDLTAHVRDTVTLDGSQSHDVDGDPVRLY